MSGVRIVIDKLRSVESFDFEFPINNGINLICGPNGVGKSTVMSAFAKIVYADALNKYFKNDEIQDKTRLTYFYDGSTSSWVKNSQGSWSEVNQSGKRIYIDGFFEGSFIYGNRFSDAHKSKINKIVHIKDKDFIDADDFVIRNLGLILRGNEIHYKGLKKTKADFNISALNLSRHCYTWFSPSGRVNQFKMSSGEYLVLTLLDYLKERLDYLKEKYERKNKVQSKKPKTLIILDEADMALHPSSQERLIDFLYEICSDYEHITDVCVYIATHSTSIIMKEKKGNIYLLDNNGGNLSVIDDCYPAYAMRDVSDGIYFDKLILVEDRLAKAYVEHIIRSKLSRNNALYQVLFIGGFKEVINFHLQAKRLRIGGAKEIINILDGDIKKEALSYLRNNKISLKCNFLPIKSVEKFIYEEVYESNNRSLISEIENAFFRVKGMRQIIADYRRSLRENSDEKELKKGKVFWKFLLQEVIEQGEQEQIFVDHVCNLVIKRIGSNQMETDLIKYIDV
ncbi:ATP-dependent nuclease [Dickeya fangzhongdai]|uniref:ATP-dependent nuclease n=1 Tax=Dickeya fangzhongdai TaxID=1778540 RepID=UPI0023E43E07|nr:AAA family ATPase [Dickeya fangzhongdai]WES87503.1 AAA family ATPase [Dickeya fangzhongdai]